LPRNLGDLLISFGHHRVGRSGDPGQADRGPRKPWGHPVGANDSHDEGTGGTRATKAAGDEEKSEPPIVPRKPGNQPEGTRWREGRGRAHRTAGGKDGRSTKAENCLNKTRADSSIGKADARDSVMFAVSPHGPRVDA
jgi:hypothetical protein